MELEKKFCCCCTFTRKQRDEPFSALKLVLGSSWTLCNMFGGYSAKLCVLGWSSKKYLECRSFITYFTDLTVWVESVSSTRSRGMKQLCNSVDASYGHCRGSQGWTFSHFKNSKQNDVWMLQMLGHFQDVAEVVKVNIATTNISAWLKIWRYRPTSVNFCRSRRMFKAPTCLFWLMTCLRAQLGYIMYEYCTRWRQRSESTWMSVGSCSLRCLNGSVKQH